MGEGGGYDRMGKKRVVKVLINFWTLNVGEIIGSLGMRGVYVYLFFFLWIFFRCLGGRLGIG